MERKNKTLFEVLNNPNNKLPEIIITPEYIKESIKVSQEIHATIEKDHNNIKMSYEKFNRPFNI